MNQIQDKKETEYIAEFNRLLNEKKNEEKRSSKLKELINSLMEAFPNGITLNNETALRYFLKECHKHLSGHLCSTIRDPELWVIIADKNDIILDASENLFFSLGYTSEDLIGAYKGMLWAERPDKSVKSLNSRAAYLIYEVKQKHFHGTHEDAYISSAGNVIPVLQHRLNINNADRDILGYLYLIMDIQNEKNIDYSLAEIMDHIEYKLSQNADLVLTTEMKRCLVKDMTRSHEYIDSVMENAIDAILVTSPAGLIISSNKSFKKLVGYSEKELRNQPVTIVSPCIGNYSLIMGGAIDIDEAYFHTMADMIDTLFKSGKVYGHRQYFKNKQGHLIPTEINISLLKNKKNEITGFVRNIHDMSEKIRLQKEIIEKEEKITLLKKEIIQYYGPDNIVGRSPAMQNIFRLIAKIADTDSTVLLEGESGTGKELIAHDLYHHSARSKGPFVALNCGAIPRDLLESELFGHVKGAFTGAIRGKKGLFEEANGGVIFLDEIGELPVEMQVKLLRAIQEREIKPLGDNRSIKIDVRIIAATHKNLLDETRKKLFREDLYYRINVITVKIPPLRERVEDIPPLVNFFIKKLKPKSGNIKISREAMKLLLDYSYPGNVRELENIIERALILCEGDIIQPVDLPSETMEQAYPERIKGEFIKNDGLKIAVSRTRDLAEKEMLLNALEKTGNNKAMTAQLLKIGRTSLYRKLKRLGI